METINREISWLSFNERVLQEAMDPTVPLIERIRFLGIYSNNMDEFYRVRVAYVRRKVSLGKQKIQGFKGNAEDLYKEIRRIVLQQQIKVELTYLELIDELAKQGIRVMDEVSVETSDLPTLKNYFNTQVRHEIFPVMLDSKRRFPTLRDDAIYLAIRFVDNKQKKRFALIQLPVKQPRFYRMNKANSVDIILLDDIIRIHLHQIFSVFQPVNCEAFTFKFTRDAELDMDDDLSDNFMQKIKKSVQQRKQGDPVRLVYDQRMPKEMLDFLLKSLELKKGINTIPGGKYHNFKDFVSFPVNDRAELLYPAQPAVSHPQLVNKVSLIEAIQQRDVLLHFPYQHFDHVVDLLREAALDPKVKAIRISIYRLAKNSDIVSALIAAAFNGKQVTVIVELQARFDEENNLYWSDRLKESGVKVIFGVPNLKVHSKILQIDRVEKDNNFSITYVGTGNFNEKTSRIYTDLSLLTADREIGTEIRKVFQLFENNLGRPMFRRLLVSPFNTRRKLNALIDQEINAAKKGKEAKIQIKLNNLTDEKLIQKLITASQHGVQIEMIIRGICCLIPGLKKISDNIKVISIVDRYLEHGRFFIFHNQGNPQYYLTSADFMERNLDKRIEVGVQLIDPNVQQEIQLIFDYQWKGSVKARAITKDLKNRYTHRDLPPFHAQKELYHYYVEKSSRVGVD